MRDKLDMTNSNLAEIVNLVEQIQNDKEQGLSEKIERLRGATERLRENLAGERKRESTSRLDEIGLRFNFGRELSRSR